MQLSTTHESVGRPGPKRVRSFPRAKDSSVHRRDKHDGNYLATVPPSAERSIRWDDPDVALPWPKDMAPRLAPKDAAAPLLAAAEVFR